MSVRVTVGIQQGAVVMCAMWDVKIRQTGTVTSGVRHPNVSLRDVGVCERSLLLSDKNEQDVG